MAGSPDNSRPEISYPCSWRYRVIGRDALTLRAVIATILGDQAYSVAEGNTSRAGKYQSVEVHVEVADEGQRLEIFYQLSWHADVAFVI